MKTLPQLLLLVLFVGTALGQDDTATPPTAATDESVPKEECEEAWEYMEFLKNDIKTKIEDVLRETLFNPSQLLEKTVADTMSEILVIRDSVLDRVKKIRTGDESITICEEQNIKQEDFLSELRTEVMTVLLRLIENDAATEEALQEVGKLLLNVRTKVNGEITKLIMLREIRTGPEDPDDCPDCAIYVTMKKTLNEVIKENEDKAEDAEGTEITMLTMLLMQIDAHVGELYSSIITELDEYVREEKSEELQTLKAITANIDGVLSQMADKPDDAAKIKRLVSRDITRLKREVDSLLDKCAEKFRCNPGPGDDTCCVEEKILEVRDKLGDFSDTLFALDEEDAKESIRSDLITYLNNLNKEMTDLLTQQIQDANATSSGLEKCDGEILELIGSIKGPLWMVVNHTLFGNIQEVQVLIENIDIALGEMKEQRCKSGGPGPIPGGCDQQEIDQSHTWIDTIDSIISESLFKLAEQDPAQARKDALLEFVRLRSSFEERVRTLFQSLDDNDHPACPEEIHQIKHSYSEHLTGCIEEMMNPRFRFESRTRAERVDCIKQLRVSIEDRRGELLFREIELRIRQRTEDSNQVRNGK